MEHKYVTRIQNTKITLTPVLKKPIPSHQSTELSDEEIAQIAEAFSKK